MLMSMIAVAESEEQQTNVPYRETSSADTIGPLSRHVSGGRLDIECAYMTVFVISLFYSCLLACLCNTTAQKCRECFSSMEEKINYASR